MLCDGRAEMRRRSDRAGGTKSLGYRGEGGKIDDQPNHRGSRKYPLSTGTGTRAETGAVLTGIRSRDLLRGANRVLRPVATADAGDRLGRIGRVRPGDLDRGQTECQSEEERDPAPPGSGEEGSGRHPSLSSGAS